MAFFHLFSILIVLVAAFAYINHRYIKLPNAIGLMFIALLFSLGIILVGYFDLGIAASMRTWLARFEFSELLLNSMLSFMLFAGAIHIRFEDIRKSDLQLYYFQR